MQRQQAQQETSLVSQMTLRDPLNHPLDQARHKLYRTAVGKLLWATPVRPDISFAVKELSRSLQAPTQQDEKQLKHLLRYLKGTLHFTTSLQPPRKRVVEQASSIQIQAFSDSDWAGCPKTRRSTSGASLSLWGVSLATSSRTQATQALSSAEAELYAMGMAIQDALHLKSLLQEMKLQQLAKPFELTVYTDSSSGKALASKLGLTRKSKHVQLRYLFMQDLVASGQLKLSKIPTEKNPADVLTKYLTASTLHKLLPKLGVMTRAADSKDLLSMISFELLACSPECPDSFFIGMMAEEPVTAQLVASRVASRPLPSSSLPPHSQEVVPNLQSSQRTFSWSSFWWYFLCVVAFLGAANFVNDNFVNFKIYGFFLSAMLVVVKIYWVISFVCKNFASTTTSLPRRALGSTSSLALGSLSPTSLQSTMLSTNPRTSRQLSASSTTILSPSALCTQCWGTKLLSIFLPIFLGWAALACQGKSLIVSASFAQRSSFSSSFPSFSFSFSNQLAAENMVSFKHEQLIKVLLANEAYTLPPSLLKHIFEGKLVNKQLEDHPEELEAAFFKELLPELPETDELEFFLVLGELAMKSFKDTSFNQLPQQKVKGASNANLGNWQASSSFAKAVSFWAWTACRAPELAVEAAYVISFKFKVQSFAAKH